MWAGGGSVPVGPPVLVDTPVEPGSLEPLVDGLVAVDPSPVVTSPPSAAPPPTAREGLEPAVSRLLALLPAEPRLRFDAAGRCVSLVLMDGAPYPRSLVRDLPRGALPEILDLAATLPELRSFGLPFARLRELPRALPSGVLALDLRGN